MGRAKLVFFILIFNFICCDLLLPAFIVLTLKHNICK